VAIANFEVFQPRYYRGTLMVELGSERVRPAYGELQVLDTIPPLLSPLGALGEFELEGLAPGRHNLRIDHERGLCDFSVEIPDGVGPVIDLGELTCEQAPANMKASP
jgi:hypothetical protein